RRALARPERWSPVHVVVVDGVHALAAPDLAELLDDGRAAGVVGMVVDPEALPEVVRAEVRIAAHPDDCEFGSVATPRHADLLIAELSVGAAMSAALAMAPLEALDRHGEARAVGRVELTDLIGLGGRT